MGVELTKAAEAMKAWREGKGLSQAAAGKRVGVRQSTWSDWETGRKVPSTTHALDLDRIAGIRIKLWGIAAKSARAA